METKARNGTTHPSQLPILVVSNQLPARLEKDEHGKYTATWCGERLLASTMAFSHQDLFRSSRRRIRFLGRVEMYVPEEDHEAVIQACASVSCIPVFPSPEADPSAFDRFCTGPLRNVFNNMIHPSTLSTQTVDPIPWSAFMSMNKDFAVAITKVYESGDLIWIQDYELIMVPHFIARTSLRHHAPIGLYLHVPFPSKQVLLSLSFREELLHSMLQAHHLGFHLYEHARQFIECCEAILHLPPPVMLQGQLVLENNGKRVAITCSQLTIDLARIDKELASNEVRDEIIQWRQLYPNKLIFAACDVVDVFHGLPQKFLALHHFLQRNPDFASRVLLIQVGILTSSLGSTEHKEVVEQVAREINANYDEPVILFDVRNERMTTSNRVALWRVAEVYVSTVFAEGLNTCPFEYIVTHRNATGLAILSQYAVACRLLHGTIIINPWNIDEIAYAMDEAVHMSLKEKEFRRDCDLVSIASHTPSRWATTIISDIATASHGASPKKLEVHTKPLTDALLLDIYRKSRGRRIFFFDYYRTLAPDVSSDFGIVWPDVPVDVLSSLELLCRDQRNTVFVVSGCNCELLSDKFGSVPGLGLVAEHGYFIRWAMLGQAARMDKPWELYGDVFRVNSSCGKWREKAEWIMQAYVDRTNGAELEMRRSSILFRYAGADYKFGLMQARELYNQLKAVFQEWPLDVIQGKDYIEVRPEGLGKGKIVRQILRKLHDDTTKSDIPIDFVWTLGDDVADELMFDAALGCAHDFSIPNVLTCTVGHKASKAQYFVSDHAQVVSLLGSVRLALTKSSRFHSVADMQSIMAKHMPPPPQISYTPASSMMESHDFPRKNSAKMLRNTSSGLAPVLEEEATTSRLSSSLLDMPVKKPTKWWRRSFLGLISALILIRVVYRLRRQIPRWLCVWKERKTTAATATALSMLALSCLWYHKRKRL
ncbi:hypothetical protein AeRB84_016332 [Aphanomyces euteiches]|nr:hypothetical protein AeRB84_016332 [Aphanomyces euteiches]